MARGWRGVATPWARDPDLKAPFLDQFAEMAFVFPRAYAAYPRFSPARAAIASGRYPHATGATREGAVLAKNEPTLAAALKENGYHAAELTNLVDTLVDTLPREQPYFLSILLDPRLSGASFDPGSLHLRENVPADAESAARDALAQRYAAYRQMDQQFGKVLAAIDASNTIVVFTSDAGEQIGSHGLDEDDTFYEESARVPLAIRIPGIKASPSDLFVSHVDLMPTLGALCGADPVEGVQGRDLSSLMTGGRGDRPESVLVEGRIGQRDEWRMLVIGVDKIVTDAAGDPTHLFNLAADPYEKRNLAAEKSAELKRDQLLAMMRAERSRLLDFRRR